MNELKISFAVVISEVGSITSYRQISTFPPTVRRVQCFSVFCGRYVQKMRPYVTVVPNGTSEWGMKSMVLVPGTSRMPCARQPSSLVKFSSRCCGTCKSWWGDKTQEIYWIHRQWSLRKSPRWRNWHSLSPAVAIYEAHGLLQHNLARICVVGFDLDAWYDVGIDVVVENCNTWS